MQQREGCSTHEARQFYGKSPCSYHSLHDTIPSGKDTCKPARSSDLSMVQIKHSCPDLKLRTCSKIRSAVHMHII